MDKYLMTVGNPESGQEEICRHGKDILFNYDQALQLKTRLSDKFPKHTYRLYRLEQV